MYCLPNNKMYTKALMRNSIDVAHRPMLDLSRPSRQSIQHFGCYALTMNHFTSASVKIFYLFFLTINNMDRIRFGTKCVISTSKGFRSKMIHEAAATACSCDGIPLTSVTSRLCINYTFYRKCEKVYFMIMMPFSKMWLQFIFMRSK